MNKIMIARYGDSYVIETQFFFVMNKIPVNDELPLILHGNNKVYLYSHCFCVVGK